MKSDAVEEGLKGIDEIFVEMEGKKIERLSNLGSVKVKDCYGLAKELNDMISRFLDEKGINGWDRFWYRWFALLSLHELILWGKEGAEEDINDFKKFFCHRFKIDENLCNELFERVKELLSKYA